MSIHTLTIDEFMRLTRADHDEALNQYDLAISTAAQELVAMEVDYDQFADGRDKLSRLLTLRKVHEVAIEELDAAEAADPEPASRPVSQQYFDNELGQLPS